VVNSYNGDEDQFVRSVINETLLLRTGFFEGGPKNYSLFNTSINEVYKTFTVDMDSSALAAVERWTSAGLVFV